MKKGEKFFRFSLILSHSALHREAGTMTGQIYILYNPDYGRRWLYTDCITVTPAVTRQMKNDILSFFFGPRLGRSGAGSGPAAGPAGVQNSAKVFKKVTQNDTKYIFYPILARNCEDRSQNTLPRGILRARLWAELPPQPPKIQKSPLPCSFHVTVPPPAAFWSGAFLFLRRFHSVGKAVPGRSDFKIFPKQKKRLEKVLASFLKSIHCVRRFDRICLFYIHYVE